MFLVTTASTGAKKDLMGEFADAMKARGTVLCVNNALAGLSHLNVERTLAT